MRTRLLILVSLLLPFFLSSPAIAKDYVRGHTLCPYGDISLYPKPKIGIYEDFAVLEWNEYGKSNIDPERYVLFYALFANYRFGYDGFPEDRKMAKKIKKFYDKLQDKHYGKTKKTYAQLLPIIKDLPEHPPQDILDAAIHSVGCIYDMDRMKKEAAGENTYGNVMDTPEGQLCQAQENTIRSDKLFSPYTFISDELYGNNDRVLEDWLEKKAKNEPCRGASSIPHIEDRVMRQLEFDSQHTGSIVSFESILDRQSNIKLSNPVFDVNDPSLTDCRTVQTALYLAKERWGDKALTPINAAWLNQNQDRIETQNTCAPIPASAASLAKDFASRFGYAFSDPRRGPNRLISTHYQCDQFYKLSSGKNVSEIYARWRNSYEVQHSMIGSGRKTNASVPTVCSHFPEEARPEFEAFKNQNQTAQRRNQPKRAPVSAAQCKAVYDVIRQEYMNDYINYSSTKKAWMEKYEAGAPGVCDAVPTVNTSKGMYSLSDGLRDMGNAAACTRQERKCTSDGQYERCRMVTVNIC